MKWLKGIGLLLIANLLIMVTISVILNVVLPLFGVQLGADTGSLLVTAGVFGFTGAFLSLAFSKQFARAMLDCRQIAEPRFDHAVRVRLRRGVFPSHRLRGEQICVQWDRAGDSGR